MRGPPLLRRRNAAASGRIPNLAGIKYTYEDMEDFARCVAFDNGRYDVLFGRDELLLSALKLGAQGAALAAKLDWLTGFAWSSAGPRSTAATAS